MFKILLLMSFMIFVVGCGDSSDSTSDNNSANTTTSVELVDENSTDLYVDDNNITSELSDIIEGIDNGDIVSDDINVSMEEENNDSMVIETIIETVIKTVIETEYVSVENFEGVEVYPSKVYSNNVDLLSMTDARLASFSKFEQIKIAQKLLSTLYYGMNVNDIEELLNSQIFIYTVLDLIKNKELTSEELDNISEEINSHSYYYRYEPLQKPLAKIFYTPMSIDFFDYYTTYVLQQSILYSPAHELDSVGNDEVTNSTSFLFSELKNKKSMEIIAYNHLNSQWNWARFRSPEDNTREMMELFLMLFDDSLVPISSVACKNYSFNDSTKKLIIDPFSLNTSTLFLFDFDDGIVTCKDFHRTLVNHENFQKTQVRRLVDLYFPTYEVSAKITIVDSILLSNPETYQDILKQIIFSEEYLLGSDKVKSIEETVFSIAKITDFTPYVNFFRYLYDDLVRMEQRTSTYKLGRRLLTPIDAKSLSYFRYTLMSKMVRDTKNNLFDDNDGGWSMKFIDSLDDSSVRAFMNNVARNFIARNLFSLELDYMEDILGSKLDISSSAHKARVAKIVMYYSIYLLTEYYRYQKIEGE